MKVYLASDHAGFELKEKIKAFLLLEKYQVEDCGALVFDSKDDYPDLISIAAKKVAENFDSLAIVFGKSGAGEAIVANKFKNVRAVLGFSTENVKLARQHNNANVLSLGSEFVGQEQAKELILLFLKTPFSNDERHIRRINKIKDIESK